MSTVVDEVRLLFRFRRTLRTAWAWRCCWAGSVFGEFFDGLRVTSLVRICGLCGSIMGLSAGFGLSGGLTGSTGVGFTGGGGVATGTGGSGCGGVGGGGVALATPLLKGASTRLA